MTLDEKKQEIQDFLGDEYGVVDMNGEIVVYNKTDFGYLLKVRGNGYVWISEKLSVEFGFTDVLAFVDSFYQLLRSE